MNFKSITLPPKYNSPLKITSIYLFFSIIWILVSDELTFSLGTDLEQYLRIQQVKGIFFVVISSLIIYFLILHDNKVIREKNKNLRKSEEEFRNIVENAPEPIFIQTDLKFAYLNNPACILFGINSKDELIGRDVMERFHPDYYPIIKDRIKKLNEDREAVHEGLEQKFIRTDGSEVWVETAGEPIEYDGKKGALVFVREITKRKKTEKELIESEKIFRNLFENHTAIKLLIDPEDGKIIKANKAAAKFYGWKVSELENMKVTAINTLSKEKIKQEMERAKENEDNYFEFIHRRKDSSLRNVEVFASGIVIKGKQYIHSVVHDVTEKKKIEEQLKLLSRSVEQSPVSVLITDPRGKIKYVNEQFRKISGFRDNEVIGENPRIMKSGKQPEELYEELWKTIRGGRNWRGELLNKKKSGELFWERVLISPVENETGRVTHFVAIKEDITKEKEMLEELRVSKEKAEVSDKLKTEFLAQMSHEIRTPLNAMMSFGSLIQDEVSGKVDAELNEGFEIFDSAGKRIIRTIDSILNMSQLSIGSYEKIESEVDLKTEVLAKVYKEYKKVCERENLELILNIETDNTLINGDDYSINQVIINLVDNAVKYTKEGRIIISLEERDEKKLMLKIADTGIGISEEFQKNLFEPFMQEHQGYTRGYEGNGLGLALVKKYCEINDIELSFSSKKGKGTVFTLLIKKNI